MTNKRKIICIAGIIALLTVATISSVMALSMHVDTLDNRFLVGEIKLLLEEPRWNDAEIAKAIPDRVISKDPMVTNIGKNEAYVFLTVAIPCRRIYTFDKQDGTKKEKTFTELFQINSSDRSDTAFIGDNSINSDWCLVDTTIDNESVRYTYVYGSKDTCRILPVGETTMPLFSSITLCPAVESSSLSKEQLNVRVIMSAIQANDITLNDKNAPKEVWRILNNQMM